MRGHDPDPRHPCRRNGGAARHGHVECEDASAADDLVAVVDAQGTVGLDDGRDVAPYLLSQLLAVGE